MDVLMDFSIFKIIGPYGDGKLGNVKKINLN